MKAFEKDMRKVQKKEKRVEKALSGHGSFLGLSLEGGAAAADGAKDKVRDELLMHLQAAREEKNLLREERGKERAHESEKELLLIRLGVSKTPPTPSRHITSSRGVVGIHSPDREGEEEDGGEQKEEAEKEKDGEEQKEEAEKEKDGEGEREEENDGEEQQEEEKDGKGAKDGEEGEKGEEEEAKDGEEEQEEEKGGEEGQEEENDGKEGQEEERDGEEVASKKSPKLCSVTGCEKYKQSGYNDMCKSHCKQKGRIKKKKSNDSPPFSAWSGVDDHDEGIPNKKLRRLGSVVEQGNTWRKEANHCSVADCTKYKQHGCSGMCRRHFNNENK